MGGSSSTAKSSQSITNNTINQDLLTTVNENLMNVSTNTLISNANTSSSSISQNNLCSIEVGNVTGDINFGGKQGNALVADFSAVNSSNAANDMNTSMMQSLISQMQSMNGTDNAAALNSAVEAVGNTGSLSTGSTASNTSTNTNVKNNVTNETISYVQNLFEQNIANNFSAETVNQCIGKTTQSNTQSGKFGDVGGNVNATCVQTNSAEQIQKCEQLAGAINETMLKTASELGLSVVTESETSSATKSETSASSSATTTGVIQDTGGLISGAISALGGLLGGLSSVWIILIIAAVLIGLFFLYSLFFSDKNASITSEGISVTGKQQPQQQFQQQFQPQQFQPQQQYNPFNSNIPSGYSSVPTSEVQQFGGNNYSSSSISFSNSSSPSFLDSGSGSGSGSFYTLTDVPKKFFKTPGNVYLPPNVLVTGLFPK